MKRNGGNILYSSLLGSNETEMESNAEISINKNGDVCFAGCTDGIDFPTTNNITSRSNRGKKDIFLTVFGKDFRHTKYLPLRKRGWYAAFLDISG